MYIYAYIHNFHPLGSFLYDSLPSINEYNLIKIVFIMSPSIDELRVPDRRLVFRKFILNGTIK